MSILTFAFVALSVFKSVIIRLKCTTSPSHGYARVYQYYRQSATSAPCRHAPLYIIIIFSTLLSSYSRWLMHVVYCTRAGWGYDDIICVSSGHTYAAERNHFQLLYYCLSRAAIHGLSASVRRRVVAEMSMGHLRRADGRDARAGACRARARAPEEDKWLKEIVYQNGFDFYVLRL